MLSNSPIGVPVQVVALGLPDSAQASISLVASMPLPRDDGLTTLPPSGESTRATIAVYDPSFATSSIQTGPPSIDPGAVNVGIGQPIFGSIQEGHWPAAPPLSQTLGIVVMSQEPGMLPAGGFGVVLAQARYDRMVYLQTGVSPLGPGSVVSQNQPESLAIESSGGTPVGRIILDGSIAGPRPFIFLRTPTDATSDTYVFPGRESGQPGPGPLIAPEGSVDSGGVPYSQTEVLGPASMPPPVDGRVLSCRADAGPSPHQELDRVRQFFDERVGDRRGLPHNLELASQLVRTAAG